MKNIFAGLGCILCLSACVPKQMVKLSRTVVETANLRLKDTVLFTFSQNYVGVGFKVFSCEEYDGFVGTSSSHEGVKVKNYHIGGKWVCEYLISPFNPYEKKYGDDTVRYIFSNNFINSVRIRKYNKFVWKDSEKDSFTSRISKSDTMVLELEDSLNFKYANYGYSIYRFSGKLNDTACGTFYISNYYGVFKEYMPKEELNYQREETSSQDFEIYWAHLYHLFYTPSFHVRCDDGPLFLFDTSYIKSKKKRCNLNEWPVK